MKNNTKRNAPRKTAKKTKKKERKEFTLLKDINAFLTSQKFTRTFGLVVVTSAILLTFAFISYLFSWEHDQSYLMGDLSELLFNKEITVANWLGKVGAIVAHVFFYKGFGVSSFVLPFLLGLWGVKLIFKVQLLPVFKTVNTSLFGLLWVSAFFGFFFSSSVLLGGLIGFQCNLWLNSILGGLGGAAILALSLVSFVIVMFNPSFAFLTRLSTKVGAMIEGEEMAESEAKEEPKKGRVTAGSPIPVQKEVPIEKEGVSTLSEKQLTEEESVLDSILKDEHVGSTELEMDIADIVTPVKNDIKEEAGLELTVENTDQPDTPASTEDFEVEVPKEEMVSDSEVDDKVQQFGEYDPKLDLSTFEGPGIDLLNDYGGNEISVSQEELEQNKNRIVETLGNYKIGIKKIKATIGPTVTLYEIVPDAGVRISKIKNLEDDIALSLAALGIRIIAPIPGKGTIGIEVPNSSPDTVSMRTLIASDKFQKSDMALPVALGKTISNETLVADLAKMPHLLMAGATGQGKSVGLNAILVSLLYKKHPSQIKFVLVDPKKVELTLFNKIERHYLAKLPGDDAEAIITDTTKVVTTLNSLCIEMDQRYELLKLAMVRNLKEYNEKFIQRRLNPENGHRYLPYIVLVVDEFADLIMTAGKEVETPIARLAQLARAIGIHLIIATQRPSVNIITGTIKANFPARIAFRVTSKIDSRTILDSGGADQLIGRGDLLFNTGSNVIRLQCGFVDTPEVEAICDFIGNQRAYPEAYILPEVIDESASDMGEIVAEDRDVKFEEAARVIVMHQQGSTSLIQRKLKLGYNRAGRIVDQLEHAGIIGPFEGSKARKVLIPDEYSLEQFLNQESQINSET